MDQPQDGQVRGGSPEEPLGLARAVESGRLASQVVSADGLGGVGDLLHALVTVSQERFLAADDRLREIGLRAGNRIFERLERRLQEEWRLGGVPDVPWGLFTRLAGQVSQRLGFGELAFSTDESSGLVHVTAWSSPFPEILGGGSPTCIAVEGLVVSLLDGVSRRSLQGFEESCRAAGADLCRFVFGPLAALRLYLADARGGESREPRS
jgi:hypothetical protein